MHALLDYATSNFDSMEPAVSPVIRGRGMLVSDATFQSRKERPGLSYACLDWVWISPASYSVQVRLIDSRRNLAKSASVTSDGPDTIHPRSLLSCNFTELLINSSAPLWCGIWESSSAWGQFFAVMPLRPDVSRFESDDEKDVEFSSTDTLIKHHDNPEIPVRHQRRKRLSWQTIALHVLAILIYGLLAASITAYINRASAEGQNLIYCQSKSPKCVYSYSDHAAAPANEAVQHETRLFNPGLKGDPEYFGLPSDEIDEKWSELMWR